MPDINYADIKNNLLEELWTDHVIKIGNILYPKRTKTNKHLKIFSLTNYENTKEITKYISASLTTREDITTYTNSYDGRKRLESLGLHVLGTSKFEDAICGSAPLRDSFHYNYINLDFTSQIPEIVNGRLEKEIKSLEEIVKLKKEICMNYYGITYTTTLNGCSVDTNLISRNSNLCVAHNWVGLTLPIVPNPTINIADKILIIKAYSEEISKKYDYTIEKKELIKTINQDFTIYSLSVIFEKVT